MTSIFDLNIDLNPRLAGFPGDASGKEPTCQNMRHKRHGFNPWVGTIPWSSKWQPILVFFPRKSHGQRSHGAAESDTEHLSTWLAPRSVILPVMVDKLAWKPSQGNAKGNQITRMAVIKKRDKHKCW